GQCGSVAPLLHLRKIFHARRGQGFRKIDLEGRRTGRPNREYVKERRTRLLETLQALLAVVPRPTAPLRARGADAADVQRAIGAHDDAMRRGAQTTRETKYCALIFAPDLLEKIALQRAHIVITRKHLPLEYPRAQVHRLCR